MYRVWNVVNRPAGVKLENAHRHFVSVDSPAEGYETIEALRERQSMRPSPERSEFGLEYLSSHGWKEWYDDGGLDVMERFGVSLPKEQPVPIM